VDLDIEVHNVKQLTLEDTRTKATYTLYPKNGYYKDTYRLTSSKNTTYLLIATNSTGFTEALAHVIIKQNMAVIDGFWFSPETVVYGGDSVLNWNYKHGYKNEKIIDKLTGKVIINLKKENSKGKIAVNQVKHPLLYTLIISNSAGKVKKDARLSVSAPQGFWTNKARINIFKPDSYTITHGGEITLYYEYSGCEKALLYNLITNEETELPVPDFGKSHKGKIKVKPTNATIAIYRLALLNSIGLSYKDITITIKPGLPQLIDILPKGR
jgi:hypothetical protein